MTLAEYVYWLRSLIGTQKVPMVFACAAVQDDRGRVLWQRRGDFGWWGLPGGVVELNESLTDCVIREVFEESGLQVCVERLLGVYSSPDFDVVYPNGDQVQQVTFTFVCRVRGGAIHVDGGETLALEWMPVETLPKTSLWYTAMITDLRLNSPVAQYKHGTAGNDRLQGPFYRHLRQYIGHQPFVAAGSVAVVMDDAGRILLQLRSDYKQWGLPGGGLELGERIDKTAVCEVKEETGLDVEIVRLSGVYSDERFYARYPNGDELKAILAVFVCRVTGGILEIDGDESLDLAFFAMDDLPPLPDFVQEMIADALKGETGCIYETMFHKTN